MKKRLGTFLFVLCGLFTFAFAHDEDQPFSWAASFSDGGLLNVTVDVPRGHYLYADDRTSVSASAEVGSVKFVSAPKPIFHEDEFGAGEIFPEGPHIWTFDPGGLQACQVDVSFQGCRKTTEGNEGICFFPAQASFSVTPTELIARTPPPISPEISSTTVSGIHAKLDRFALVRSGGGYMGKDKFLAFLGGVATGADPSASDGLLKDMGALALIFFVLLGGLMLNLTPCVLPMIPVNLAIIGAGSASGDKRRGFIRGTVYASGIALAYGILGIVTVVSGATLGTISSSSLFNFAVAGIFIFLALAMFDILSIDFTRFSTFFPGMKSGQASLFPVFLMGGLAALLAGACVAPVVIAVLLHSTAIYSAGNIAGLFLPLVLGIGMALPWPFAGAGISLLPKPGAWMVRVKQTLGIFIFLFAAYYAYLAFSILSAPAAEESFRSLDMALDKSMASGKPVLVDFWATWCKNCLEMDRTTFKHPEVVDMLGDFVLLKFQAENISDPGVKSLLDRFGIIGLPGFVILSPAPAKAQNQ